MAERAFNSYATVGSITGSETLLIAQGASTYNTTPDQVLQAGLDPTFGVVTADNLVFAAAQSVSNVLAAPSGAPGIPTWRQLTTDDIAGVGTLLSSPPPIGDVTPNTGAFTSLSATGTIGVASNQVISFNYPTNTRTLGYVSADTALEYKASGTKTFSIADTGLVTGYRGITATGFLASGNILSANSNLVGATGSTLAQNFSSVIGSATGTLTAGSYVYNLIQMQSDNLNVGSASNSEAVLLGIYDGFGGTGVSGARTPLRISLAMTAATNNPISSFHRGISVGAITSYPDGGTSGTPRGKWFGSIITANMNSGATNWEALSGQEIDVTANSGSSVLYKSGLAIVHQSTDAVRGSLMDAGLLIADQSGSAVGWKNLIAFGSVAGVWAGASDSVLIGTLPTLLGGSPYVATHGVKFDTVTLSGNAWASDAYSVTGSGQQTIGSNTITWGTSGLTIGTAGSVSTAAAVASGGGGYQVNGHLRAAGGVFLITSVSAGVVTGVSTITAANVTGSTPSNPVATTSNTGGSGATLNLTWTTASAMQTTGGRIRAARVVTAAGAVTVAKSDDIVVINKTVGAATAVSLPATPETGRQYTVKDGKGDAAANNITITPAAGNIDGAATLVIATNYGAAVMVYNGTQWNVI